MLGANSSSPISTIFTASYTAGAPGTPSHAWEVAPSSPDAGVEFINPLSSSSQRIRINGTPLEETKIVHIRDKITASDGQFSYTPNVVVSYFRSIA